MNQNDELKRVGVKFTSYLVRSHLISNLGVSEELLINWYRDFQLNNPSRIDPAEIVSALSIAHSLRKRLPEESNGLIYFKNGIFRKSMSDLKPRIRVFKNQSRVFHIKGDKESEIDGLFCKICNFIAPNDLELQNHKQSELHQLRQSYRIDGKLLKRKSKVPFFEFDELDEHLAKNEKKTFKLVMKNVSQEKANINILRIHELMNTGDIKMSNISAVIKIPYGEIFEFPMTVCLNESGSYQIINVFVVREETSNETINLLVTSRFVVVEEEYRYLDSKETFQRPVKNSILLEDLELIRGRPIPNSTSLIKYVVALESYMPPAELNRLLNNGLDIKHEYYKLSAKKEVCQLDAKTLQKFKDLFLDKKSQLVLRNKDGLTETNYYKRFQYLLWIEEHQLTKDIHDYDRVDVQLKCSGNDLYELEVTGLAEGRPSVMRGDSVCIRHKNAKDKYEGIVHEIKENLVLLAFDSRFRYISKQNVDVEFTLHRHSLRIQHRALQKVSEGHLFHFIFPKSFGEESKPLGKVVFKNPSIANNSQQRQAVHNILQNTAYPAPYIIYGPPGTGKTSTIVEAIAQVFIRGSDQKVRICACAPSNAAADLLAERLLTSVPPSSVYRLYSMSRSPKSIPEALQSHSNYNKMTREIGFPNRKELIEKQIVVVTPITAGRLYGVTGGEYFDYVFFDEAGHAEEPLAIILLSLLKRKQHENGKLQGNLILAGDPKQLGPIIHSKLALEVGLAMSLLERLMIQNNLYQKDPVTGEYNAKVVTKLLNNYRSHPILLKVPNELFYDGELNAEADRLKTDCLCSWKKLPVKNFPLLFHGVRGAEKREQSSPSYFNVSEIQVVVDYIQSLMENKINGYTVKEKDIVILSPYRQQIRKIRTHLCNKKWKDIEVKSVEEFQGQEKLIVIISTVRSREEFLKSDYVFGIGFLRNPKRFNVAVTRAKALMIVVGNPDILQTDPNWRKLIELCVESGSYKGVRPSGPVPPSLDPNKILALDLSVLTIAADNIPESEKPSFSRND